MNAIHGIGRNIVLSIRAFEQRVEIDHLNALRCAISLDPLVQLNDALESLWTGIRPFREKPGPHGGMVPITTPI